MLTIGGKQQRGDGPGNIVVPQHMQQEVQAAVYLPMQNPSSRIQKPLKLMAKSSSTPSLRSLGIQHGGDGELEVYVVLRNFQEFGGGVFHRLPEPLRDGLRDTGVCHYMTVFKQKDGTLVQFDFGPLAGGDIHVSAPGPLGRVLGKSPKGSRNKQRVDGQVRERKISSLPNSHMYVGTTHLSLAEIRSWNRIHAATVYELHRSDCRHYVNALVRYTTGVERAAASALRHQLARSKDRIGIAAPLIRLGQYFTDAANWERVRAIGHATNAALMTLAGHQTIARLGAAPLLRSMRMRMMPGAARGALVPVQRAFIHRPMYAASTAAVATMATSNERMSVSAFPGAVRGNVIQTVQSAMRMAASLADNIGRTASIASQRTASTAASLASGLVQAASSRPVRVSSSTQVIQQSKAPNRFWGIGTKASDGQNTRRRLEGVQHLALIAARR
eukprot:jgi/Picsp_1/4057/NSC_01568-R1_protein